MNNKLLDIAEDFFSEFKETTQIGDTRGINVLLALYTACFARLDPRQRVVLLTKVISESGYIGTNIFEDDLDFIDYMGVYSIEDFK